LIRAAASTPAGRPFPRTHIPLNIRLFRLVEAALTTLPLLAFFFFIVDVSFAVSVKNTLVPRGGAMWRFLFAPMEEGRPFAGRRNS